MGKIVTIFPGFNVEPGNFSLTVCDYDFLKRKLGDKLENYGAGFDREMSDRFAGKKLKLHHIRKLKGGPSGAIYHLYFSEDSDLYIWNEYMFKEYWNAGGRVDYINVDRAKAVKRDVRSFDDDFLVEKSFSQKQICAPSIGEPTKMSKLFKLMFIMNMMNGKK